MTITQGNNRFFYLNVGYVEENNLIVAFVFFLILLFSNLIASPILESNNLGGCSASERPERLALAFAVRAAEEVRQE